MNRTTLLSELRAAFPALAVRENEPLARHCSFRIGGPAAVMLLPDSADGIASLCRWLRERGVKPFLLGNGTNMLFPDEGLDRIVVKTAPGAGRIAVDGARVVAEAGATLAQTASAALAAGLTGLEFAHGIPGSVGGGVVMNAGAYGGELKDAVVETEYLDAETELRVLRGAEHDFSYRHSYFSDHEGIVLRSVFSLAAGDPEAIAARMRELNARRRDKQPLNHPSAGSTFKRPEGQFAGALIEQAGLKGRSVGGAQVSEKHAGFIVNTGGATATDILTLIGMVQDEVRARFGVRLETEVRILGED